MKTICFVILFLTMCGCSTYNNDPAPTPTEPNPVPTPPGPNPTPPSKWLAIKPIVLADCVPCHDGIKQRLNFNLQSDFDGSLAQSEIASGQMPPNRALPSDDKQKLLQYFQ